MIEVILIGIGTGAVDHLTLAGVKALNRADLILVPRKGANKADLAEVRLAICRAVLTNPTTRLVEFDLPVRDQSNPDYLGGVDDWHDAVAAVWAREIGAHQGVTGVVASLVWGDPSLYDSTLRIAERLKRLMDLKVTVVPGITAIQALTAAHAIPLNEIGGAVQVMTGRDLRENGWPDGVYTIVVMLVGHCAFQTLDPKGISIWWAAYAGMPVQILRLGDLASVSADIIATRAAARLAHGWIMDIYLLRRSQEGRGVRD